jgi:hypothetical protein
LSLVFVSSVGLFIDEYLIQQDAIMISNDNDSSTNTVTIQSETQSSHENNPMMSSTDVSLCVATGDEHDVRNESDEQNETSTSNDNRDERAVVEQKQNIEQGDEEFIRITAAHQILTEGNIRRQTHEHAARSTCSF